MEQYIPKAAVDFRRSKRIMTPEDKELLLKDLCARLPYGVMIHIEETNESEELYCLNIPQEGLYTRNKEHHNISSLCPIEQAKPYFRPMSSMTEEEKEKFINLRYRIELGVKIDLSIYNYLNFLYSHHIDVDNRLLNKKLAIEAPEDMYNIK